MKSKVPELLGRGGGDDSGATVSASTHPNVPRYQIIYMILAYFYLVLAIIMVFMSVLTPDINVGATVAFVLLAVVVFVAAIVQIVYRKELVAYACGTCPLPAISF